MSHYRSNVRDQVFNLFEVLGVDKALGHGEFSDVDVDTARDMLPRSAGWPRGRWPSRSSKGTATRPFSTRKPTR